MKLKFSVFIHLKIADLAAKIFNALLWVYFLVLTFETKKMPKKRTIFPLKIQLCPQISTKIAIKLQTMSCSPIKASVQISASCIEWLSFCLTNSIKIWISTEAVGFLCGSFLLIHIFQKNFRFSLIGPLPIEKNRGASDLREWPPIPYP